VSLQVNSTFKNLTIGLELPDGQLNVLTGPNNSGKSAILQWLNIASPIAGESDYVSPRRFDLSNQVAIAMNADDELRSLFQQRKQYNDTLAELTAPDPIRELVHLNDSDRAQAIEWHNRYFGKLVIEKAHPENEFSAPRITIDGRLATQQGSGSRAVLSVLVALLDRRSTTILIDEPEIGIEPQVQRRLFELIRAVAYGRDGVPQKRVYLATHSHLFLDREQLGNNYFVTKGPDGFAQVRQVASLDGLAGLVYTLLGNSPVDLFFPENILIVEGPSDQVFFRRLIELDGGAGIAIHFAGGDGKVSAALPAVEQMLKTQAYLPLWYRDRICVVVDSSVNDGRVSEWQKFLGDDGTRVRKLSKDGIEYYYPRSVLREVAGMPMETIAEPEMEAAVTEFLQSFRNGAREATLGAFHGSKRQLANAVAEAMGPKDLAETSIEIREMIATLRARSYSAEIGQLRGA
jgi:ABC-type branched-subunit amino acid transport system ATPase component